jgi:hypothetical protein
LRVAERRAQARGDAVEPHRIDFAVDLEQLPGFRLGAALGLRQYFRQLALRVAPHVDDGMHDEVHRAFLLLENDSERVDQERHVFGDDGDDRVARGPAVDRRIGIEDANEWHAGFAAGAEREMRERCRGEIFDGALAQILFGDAVEVGADETGGEWRAHARAPPASLLDDAFDQREARSGNFAEHGRRCLVSRVVRGL